MSTCSLAIHNHLTTGEHSSRNSSRKGGMGTEVSITKGSPCGGQLSASRAVAYATPFTLNDLYVSAGTPVNSLSLEPGRQLRIDGTIFSSSSKNSQSPISNDESAGQKN